jgi:hypothetical protein
MERLHPRKVGSGPEDDDVGQNLMKGRTCQIMYRDVAARSLCSVLLEQAYLCTIILMSH